MEHPIIDILPTCTTCSSVKILKDTSHERSEKRSGFQKESSAGIKSNIDISSWVGDGWNTNPLLPSIVEIVIPLVDSALSFPKKSLVPVQTKLLEFENVPIAHMSANDHLDVENESLNLFSVAFDDHYKKQLLKKSSMFSRPMSWGSFAMKTGCPQSSTMGSNPWLASSSSAAKHMIQNLSLLKRGVAENEASCSEGGKRSQRQDKESTRGDRGGDGGGKNDKSQQSQDNAKNETNDEDGNSDEDDGESNDDEGSTDDGNHQSDDAEESRPKLEFTMIVDDFLAKSNLAINTPQVSDLFGDDTIGHWRLLVYPRSHRGGEQWCSAYVAAAVDVDNLGHGWWKKVDFSITAIHPDDPKYDIYEENSSNAAAEDDSNDKDTSKKPTNKYESITKKGTNTFKGRGATLANNFEWGYNDLVKVDTLMDDGFLSSGGRLAFKVELTILDTKVGLDYDQLSEQDLQDDLVWAVGVGAVPIVTQCLQNDADPSYVYHIKKKTETPLHKASCMPGWRPGALEVVSLLVASGADVNECNSLDETPLLLAADVSGSVEICRWLLLHGADPTIRTSNGWSPFNCAAKRGRNEIISLLISFGCPIEEPIPEYSGLLHAAAQGHVETIKLLLKYGIEVNVCDKHGDTALWKLVDKDLADVALLMAQEYHASIPRCSRDRKKVTKARLILKHAEKKKKLKDEENGAAELELNSEVSEQASDAGLVNKSDELMEQLVAEEDQALREDEKKKLKKKKKRDRAKTKKSTGLVEKAAEEVVDELGSTAKMDPIASAEEEEDDDNIDLEMIKPKVKPATKASRKKKSKSPPRNSLLPPKLMNISSVNNGSYSMQAPTAPSALRTNGKLLEEKEEKPNHLLQKGNEVRPASVRASRPVINHKIVPRVTPKPVAALPSPPMCTTQPPSTVEDQSVIYVCLFINLSCSPLLVLSKYNHVFIIIILIKLHTDSKWLDCEWGNLEKDILSLTAFED